MAAAALGRAAVKCKTPSASPVGPSPSVDSASEEARYLLGTLILAAPAQWQTPRTAHPCFDVASDQTPGSSFWGRKAAAVPIGEPPASLNTADPLAVRSFLQASAALCGICISADQAAAKGAAALASRVESPAMLYAAHVASGVAGSGGPTSRVLDSVSGPIAVREGVYAAEVRRLKGGGELGGLIGGDLGTTPPSSDAHSRTCPPASWSGTSAAGLNLLVPLPPPAAGLALYDPALSQDPGAPSDAHARAYDSLLAALQDPRVAVRLEAARLLACGGLPRLVAHGIEPRRPRRGAPMVVDIEALARLRSVPAVIRAALHSGVIEGLLPQICSALRAAIAWGVAASAFEAQMMWQLRRVACATAVPAAPPRAAAIAVALRGGWRVISATAVASSLLVDALCRVTLLADGGAAGPARGILAHPCNLALRAVLWCCPALALSIAPLDHPGRGSGTAPAETASACLDSILAAFIGVTPGPRSRLAGAGCGPTWASLRSAALEALPDEDLRLLRDARRASLALLQDIPQRATPCTDMREWLRCLGDRAAAYARVQGPVPALVAALPLLWFRQACGRYDAGSDAGASSCFVAPGGTQSSPGWSGLPPAGAWSWAAPEATAEVATAANLRRGAAADEVRAVQAPRGIFLRLVVGGGATMCGGGGGTPPLFLIRGSRTPPCALETLVASWDVLRWLSPPALPESLVHSGAASLAGAGAACDVTTSGGATFDIAALGAALLPSSPPGLILTRQPGGSSLLVAALLQLSDGNPPPLSAHHAYMVSRAATTLYAQLSGLTEAAVTSAAYFYSSLKLKRCVQGVGTARRPPALTSTLVNWPVLGGLQPGTAAAAVWGLLELRALSLAAWHLRTYALPVSFSSPLGLGSLWGSRDTLVPRLAPLYSDRLLAGSGWSAAVGNGTLGWPREVALPMGADDSHPVPVAQKRWQYPATLEGAAGLRSSCGDSGAHDAVAAGGEAPDLLQRRRRREGGSSSVVEGDAEQRRRRAWARLVSAAAAAAAPAAR